MTSTKRELEEISRRTGKLERVLQYVVRALRPLFRIVYKFGPLRRAAANSLGGRVGVISRLEERGEHAKAVELAIDALKEYRYRPDGKLLPSARWSWWFFMHLAVSSLEECDDSDKWDELIAMARDGVEPFEGFYVAQSQLAFSRWKYRIGDYDAAVAFAETAAGADATWGEPEFTLGWYYLALGGGDALAYFTEAIRKDRGILFRIASDPLCRQHPHIIQRLKEFSAAEIAGGARA